MTVLRSVWRFLNEPMDTEVRLMLALAYAGLATYILIVGGAALFDVSWRIRGW